MGLMSIRFFVVLSFVIRAAASRQRDAHSIGICKETDGEQDIDEYQAQQKVATLTPAWDANTAESDGDPSTDLDSSTDNVLDAEVQETSKDVVEMLCSNDPGSSSLDDCRGYTLQTQLFHLFERNVTTMEREDMNERERLFRLANCVWRDSNPPDSKCVKKADSIPLEDLRDHLTKMGAEALVTQGGKVELYYPDPYPSQNLQWQHAAREEGYEKGTIAVQHRYIGDQTERQAVVFPSPEPLGNGDLGPGFYVTYQGADAIMRPLIYDASCALTKNLTGDARPTSISTSIYALSVREGQRFLVVRDSFKAGGNSLLKEGGPAYFKEHGLLGFMKMRMAGVQDEDMEPYMNGLDTMEFNILDPQATLEFKSAEACQVVEGYVDEKNESLIEFEDPANGGPLPDEWFPYPQ